MNSFSDVGVFWYSEKQREIICRPPYITDTRGKEVYPRRCYCILEETGEEVEYTEWKSGEFIDNPSNFDDAICLGRGRFSRMGDLL